MSGKQKIIYGLVFFLIAGQCYRYFPFKLEYLGYYDSKIGAHMCNDISKLKSATNYFQIVELDIVYDSENNNLDIYHPPKKSTGLFFDNYLKQLKSINKDVFLWLDIKNLKEENATEIYDKLTFLLKKHQFSSNRVLVETRYPKALNIFINNNFQTSYYITKKINKLKEEELKRALNSIRDILEKQPKMAISFSHEKYDILSQEFPKKKKYIWNLVRSVNLKMIHTRIMLNDETVKIVLINFKPI